MFAILVSDAHLCPVYSNVLLLRCALLSLVIQCLLHFIIATPTFYVKERLLCFMIFEDKILFQLFQTFTNYHPWRSEILLS